MLADIFNPVSHIKTSRFCAEAHRELDVLWKKGIF